jgi:hypothetical protein
LQLPLQLVVFGLFLSNLADDGAAIALIMFLDERWYEVSMLRCLLGGGQARTGGFPLARALDFAIQRRGVLGSILSFSPDLLLQLMEIEIAQSIGAQTAALEALVGGDMGVVLQQLRNAAEDLRAYAIGVEGLEQ